MAKRRKWLDELKNDVQNDEENKKIKVLNEKIYLDGTLVKETNIKEDEKYDCIDSKWLATPHNMKNRNVNSLTPTFRNPNSYITETKKILKKLTPQKLAYDSISDFNELIDIQESQNVNDNSSIDISVDHLLEKSTKNNQSTIHRLPQYPFPDPGTTDELDNYRAASVPRTPSPRPGTSDEYYAYQAASVHLASPRRETSEEHDTYQAASVHLTSPRRETSEEHDTYQAASVHLASSRPGTSNEHETHQAAIVHLTSPRPGTSDEHDTYQLASVHLTSPRPRTSDEHDTYQPASVHLTSPRPGTSDEHDTYQPASVHLTSPRRETSEEHDTYQAASVHLASSRPGTSDEHETHQAASVHLTSPRRETSEEHDTYQAASVHLTSPRPGTNDEHDTCQDDSVHLTSPKPGTSNEPPKRQPKRKVKQYGRKPSFDESYVDFVFDKEDRDTLLLNEAFPSEESDSWNDFSLDESDEKPKKKKKNKQRKNYLNGKNDLSAEKKKPKSQIKKENKKNKNLGKRHTNTKGTIIEEKAMKPNPCTNNKCSNHCGDITEERRYSLFSHFWKLESTQRRRDWIAQITEKTCVKSRTVEAPEASRRQASYAHFINEGEGRRKVCQKFLINTLDITQKFILYTVNHKIDGFAKLDERGKNTSHNKTPAEKLEHVKSFILSLPLLPSHHSRKDSQRLYFQEDIKNITNLYSIYVEHCKADDTKPVSFKVFSAYFKQNFNIGFHVPKKDKCVLCSSKTYDVLTKEEVDKIDAHLKEKEASYNRFIFHQNLKDRSVLCASFDLQKVLNTPHGKHMSLYYSRKISVYNFTIYESGTQEGFCHIWNETDALRGANEVATILLDYIKDVDSRGYVKTLLLYADSCFGQNKNRTVLSMLRYALANTQNLEVIQINYLVPGHTYMPVDSMHAVIERSVKNTMIWAPSLWPTVIALSRKNPFPYKVTSMEGKKFKGFEDILNNTFKKSQKIKVSTISVATFKKNNINIMFVKRSMLAEAGYTEVNLSAFQPGVLPKENLYPNKLPISAQKYADLKKLLKKKVIPAIYANEYLDLKYSSKTVDCLAETDEEDNF